MSFISPFYHRNDSASTATAIHATGNKKRLKINSPPENVIIISEGSMFAIKIKLLATTIGRYAWIEFREVMCKAIKIIIWLHNFLRSLSLYQIGSPE